MEARLKSLKLEGIKNVGLGKVSMPNSSTTKHASVLGIYGQNGSGKTAVIDTLKLLQNILIGRTLEKSFAECIDVNRGKSRITMELTLHEGNIIFDVEYVIELKITKDGGVSIASETISKKNEATDSRKITFIHYRDTASKYVFTPQKHYEELIESYDGCEMDLMVAKKMAEKSNASYIFSEAACDIFINIRKKYKNSLYFNYASIICEVRNFALFDLFVISDTHSGIISAGLALPMAFRIEEDRRVNAKGDFAIPLMGPANLSNEHYEVLNHILEEINTVLYTIIPGLSIKIHPYGKVMMDNGEEANRFELVSVRENSRPIPIRMESEGVIKIISILNALIHAYTNPAVCLAVDELDAGIFEYMLGELLDIFQKGAKGQLIFTSHNLRALEMLNVENVVFSTANPEKRYVHMTNIRPTNNFRDAYIRAITLGGQKESLYTETDSLKIARAFRKAGRKIRSTNFNEGKEGCFGPC